jgi:hypothetical protein
VFYDGRLIVTDGQSEGHLSIFSVFTNRHEGTLIMSGPMVRGNVHVIEETKTYGQNGFRKRLVVLEQDNGRFVNYLPMEFIQDACDSVDELSVGDEVEISYRLSGRKWQRDQQSEVKYFLSAEATEFKVLQKAGDKSGGPTADPSEAPFADDEAPF